MLGAIIPASVLLLGQLLLVAKGLQNGKMGVAKLPRRLQLSLCRAGAEGSPILLEEKQAIPASCYSWCVQRGETVFAPLKEVPRYPRHCPEGK